MKDECVKVAWSCLFYLFVYSSLSGKGLAQIVPDNTLPTNSIVKTQGNINLIEGGTTAGSNLFHSFQEFSIPTGGAGIFNNALNIQNIFSRVTGNSISNIDGLIKANGTANLFFLNPNGIIFGPNTRLNIGGSFLATTANSFTFTDGTQFRAQTQQTTPLLTISVPVGLQFGTTTGNIQVKGNRNNSNSEINRLQVKAGKSLALVGGNVKLDEGVLKAYGGRIELGSIAGEGTVELNTDSNFLSLNFPDSVVRGDVTLFNSSLNVIGKGKGSIAINSRNLDIFSSSINAGIGKQLGFEGSQAGNINLNATGAIKITSSFVNNNIAEEGIGSGGDINIKANSLLLSDVSTLDTGTFGEGNAGNIRIFVDGDIYLDNSRIFSDVQKNVVGNGGNIEIQTGSLTLTNGAQLITSTSGEGKAGNIQVNAVGDVTISGGIPNFINGELAGFSGSGFLSNTEASATGEGGSIYVKANSLQIFDGAVLQAVSRNEFDGGNIGIDVNYLELNRGGQIFTTSTDKGAAGSIVVNATKSVTISGSDTYGNVSSLQAQSAGNGDADNGNITIVTGIALIDSAFLETSNFGEGKAGNISVKAQEIAIANSNIFSDTRGAGTAGNILLQAEKIEISQGYITSEVVGSAGNGGTIDLKAGTIYLTNGTKLSTDSGDDFGSPGAISIAGSNQVSIIGSSMTSKSSNSDADANVGTIKIIAPEGSILLDGATLNTTNFSTGIAGDIIINARDEVAINQSIISSEGDTGYILLGRNQYSGEIYSPRSVVIENSKLTTSNVVSDSDNGNSETLSEEDETTVNAGAIVIDALDRISITNSQLEATTNRSGNAAGILLQTKKGEVSISASNVQSLVGKNGQGNAGDILIISGSLTLSDGASLNVSTYGKGNAGVVFLQVDKGQISISGSSIQSIVGEKAEGNGLGISIKAGSLTLSNGSFLDAATFGTGNAGIVQITATDSVSLDGVSNIYSTVESGALGNAGGIFINTKSFSLTNKSQLTAEAMGTGKAGNVTVEASKSMFLDSGAVIKADTRGGEGNIYLKSPFLLMRRGSSITTNAKGSNIVGGDIQLDTDIITLVEDSRIEANSDEFRGGRVIVNTKGLFSSPASKITATGGGGNPELSGVVEINSPNVDPSSGLVELPANPVDATRLVASACRDRNSENSQFIITGRGGLPPNPLEAIDDEATWIDLRPRVTRSGNSSAREQTNSRSISTPQIIEAQGWSINEKGQVELVAKTANSTLQSPSFVTPECIDR